MSRRKKFAAARFPALQGTLSTELLDRPFPIQVDSPVLPML
jgi:hypothetical protein